MRRVLGVCGVMCMMSCSEVVEIPGPDESGFGTVADTWGYVRNTEEPRSTTVVEIRSGQSVSTQVYFGMTRPSSRTSSVTFRIDDSALAAYNLSHGTSYEAYPAGSVSLESDGRILMSGGSMRSSSMRITVRWAEGLSEGKTYAVPVRVTPPDESVRMNRGEDVYMLLVRNMGSIPDASKASGIKILSCMEVNDTNPLNNLEFTLRNSGKMLFDIVVLFAANMNYDAATGKVYIHNNENIQHLLDNRDKYLRPLQQRGIKVVLAMLGNHDRAGVSGLADDTARAFALDLKHMCEAYELDGIFWDDEYSKYAAGPGFVYPVSKQAAARLIYETKKAMPDKLNIVYMACELMSDGWNTKAGSLDNLPSVDGIAAGSYVDYALNDYRRDDDQSGSGFSWSQVGIYPEEYAKGVYNMRQYTPGQNEYDEMKQKGCGIHMIFGMDPTRSTFREGNDNVQSPDYQYWSLQNIARELFGDQLVWSGETYSKDW